MTPEHLNLSEWCGLAQRLLSFVERANKAARGLPGWQWGDELKPCWQEDEGYDSEDEETIQSSSQTPLFDPRHNAEHNFILNAAISASLILRNLVDVSDNVIHLSREAHIVRIAYDCISLPEHFFGFEDHVDAEQAAIVDEGETRLEGIRELRMYWMEILQDLAPRLILHQRSNVVRFEDGSVKKAPLALDGAADLPLVTGSVHAHSDAILTHTLLLLHSTADRALLIASLRVLALLISNSRTAEEVFLERSVVVDGRAGWSPGIVSRCRELLPLAYVDQPLIEQVMDTLDASIDVAAMTKPTKRSAVSGQDAAAGQVSYPNALKFVSGCASQADGSHYRPQMSAMTFLSNLLTLNATYWERAWSMSLHRESHPYQLIPSRHRHEQEKAMSEPSVQQHRKNWLSLRSLKAESALIDYITASEKKRLQVLPEPQRLGEWLKLVTRTAGGPGSNEANDHYITQMQLWTSYRDTFGGAVDASHAKASQDPSVVPLVALIPPFEVISEVAKVFPDTAAVLIREEDPRIGGDKFVIRGLEGHLRPEVIRYYCGWRGCPQHRTDSAEAQVAHIKAHIAFSQDGATCEWAKCGATIKADDRRATREETERLLLAHVKTHLPDSSALVKPTADESATTIKPKATLPIPPNGRSMPIKAEEPSPAPKSTVHPHAISASRPSRFTFDRPSAVRYKVSRTPFKQETGIGEGPAYYSAKILKRIAQTCRAVLGDAASAADYHDEDDEDDEAGGSHRGKKVKLDFSDRLVKETRFGMPFTMPANFKATIEVTEEDFDDELRKTRAEEEVALTTEGKEVSRLREEALDALDGLMSLERELVERASCNDIISGDLVQALSEADVTFGSKGRRRKRPTKSMNTESVRQGREVVL